MTQNYIFALEDLAHLDRNTAHWDPQMYLTGVKGSLSNLNQMIGALIIKGTVSNAPQEDKIKEYKVY